MKRARRLSVLAAIALATVTSAGEAGSQKQVGPLRLQLPDGWTDVSRDAPPENRAELAPATVSALDRFDLVAVDLAGGADGFAENLNVQIQPCPGPFSAELVKELGAELRQKMPGLAPGSQVSFREEAVVELSSVSTARFVWDQTIDGRTTRILQYHLPSGHSCAILTWTSTSSDWDRYLPIFEAATRATSGLAEPPRPGSRWERMLSSALLYGAIGAGVGLVAAVLGRRAKRHRPDRPAGP